MAWQVIVGKDSIVKQPVLPGHIRTSKPALVLISLGTVVLKGILCFCTSYTSRECGTQWQYMDAYLPVLSAAMGEILQSDSITPLPKGLMASFHSEKALVFEMS